jgi:hypothetical protein
MRKGELVLLITARPHILAAFDGVVNELTSAECGNDPDHPQNLSRKTNGCQRPSRHQQR